MHANTLLVPRLLGQVALSLLLAGCNTTGSTSADASATPLDAVPQFPGNDAAWAGPCDVIAHPCNAGQLCYEGTCVADNGPCLTNDDCENDSYCTCGGGFDAGPGPCQCLPYGVGPGGTFDVQCVGQGFPAAAFLDPVVKCHWEADPGADSTVRMTPLVVDLDRNGKPKIVFSTMGKLVVIEGATCKTVWTVPSPLAFASNLAAGDLDGDGHPEIVLSNGSQVAVFDRTGTLLATADTGIDGGDCGGAAIADVDGAAPPEIVANGAVLRYRRGQPMLEVLWSAHFDVAREATLPLFADLDGDGRPEVVTGPQVFDGRTGKDKRVTSLMGLAPQGAFSAIADFNRDGKPEVVVAAMGGTVTIVDYAHDKVLFSHATGATVLGPPTIGDYDHDGTPDVGVASPRGYFVLALRCSKAPRPKDCADDGVLWSRNTQDGSSGYTGSSTFDFNGDGAEEVVYRDECFLRVMSGANGKTLFATPVSSGTCTEYPVVADVDHDGHADLVVPADTYRACAVGTMEGQLPVAFTKPNQGIFVLTDPKNRWVSTRALWTSHTYHITEITDGYAVPAHEPPSWQASNTYRDNLQGTLGPNRPSRPDFTAGASAGIDGSPSCSQSETLYARLCNRGGVNAPAGIPGAFYASDPRAGVVVPLCVAQTAGALAPGECEEVSCQWPSPPAGAQDVWFRANDDGHSAPLRPECHNGNDLLILHGVHCGGIG